MRTEGFKGTSLPKLVAVSIAVTLLALTLALTGSSSGTHDATVSMAPVNSKAGVTVGHTLTVANASGDNIDNVTLEVPLDEGGNARYRVAAPVPAPENWIVELPENDGFGYAKKITWRTDNAWAHIAAGGSEDFTFTATTPLYDGTYNWTCRTRDISAYVDSDAITTRVDNVPPPPPTLVWPKNDENINDNTPNLDWDAVTENSLPVTYDLLVDNDPGFLSPEVDITRIASDDYVTSELVENIWYWKVRAIDNAGNIGPWSSPKSFRVDITPPEPPTRVWPGDGENINDNTPNLDWDPVIDPSMPVAYDLMFRWWNENWTKRRPITISGSHPENYQIKVVLPFYDNSIRFLENENVGVLPYWIENYTPDNMTVWVRRLENTDSTIYVYCKNPSVGNVGNFDNTFAKDYGESGLVALWHMDEGSGTTTADSSGNNNTAALTTTGLWRATDGGHWDNRSDIKFSTGAHENNAGGWYITVPSSTSMDSYENFTLETWVKITSLGWKTFFEKRSGDTYGFAVGLHTGGDDRFRFTLWTTPGSELLSLDGSAQLGKWYHVAVTYYNPTKEMKIYVDGTLQNTGTANNYFQNTGLTTYLGTNCTDSQNFGGAFDEFRLYNRVLSASEIKSHYERRKFMSPEPTVNVRGEEIVIQRTTDDNYQITTELSEGIWHWKLRVVDNAGNIGVWFPLRSFRVDITPPLASTLLAPADKTKTSDNTPTFRWTAITIENSLPATYDLQVDNDNNFLSPEVNVTGLTDNTYTQPSELPNGNYSWRVRAWDNAGNPGPWSSTWTLLINSTPHDATATLKPVNSKPGISTDYTLTVTDNATGDNIDNVTLVIPLDENGNALYRVATPIPAPAGWTSGVPEIDENGYARKIRWRTDNPWAHIAGGESENFTFAATTPLYDGIYTWTCLTRDIIGYIDNDSTATRVDNVPPDAPTLLEPDDGATITDNTPTFRWTVVPENSLPVTYTLQVDNDNDFSSPEINVSGLTDNEFTPPAALADDNYSWRVRATDNAGNVGPFSPTWTLVIMSTGVGISVSPDYQSGVPGAMLDYTVTVTNTGNIADNYDLTVSDNAGWGPTLSENRFENVPPNENRTATLSVVVPENAHGCTEDNLIVIASGTGVEGSASCIAHASIVRRVEVLISPGYQTGPLGGTLTYEITVKNTGNVDDNYALAASDNAGWGPTLSENRFENVKPGENRTTTLEITIQENAMGCTRDNITMIATSQTDNTVSDNDSCIAHAQVMRGVEVLLEPEGQIGVLGENVAFTVTVKNTGNVWDNYNLTPVDDAGWALKLDNDYIEIPKNENRKTKLTVTIPDNENLVCTTDNVNVIATAVDNAEVTDNDNATVHAVPHWTGTAGFSLINLYTLNVEKILDLNQGSKLVVKFYTYGDTFENENVIENFSPPWHVEENENARHPGGIGVKKARLVLTNDNTEDVKSTIASFVVSRSRLMARISAIKSRWPYAQPPEKSALISEISGIKSQWPYAPS